MQELLELTNLIGFRPDELILNGTGNRAVGSHREFGPGGEID